MAPPDRLRRSHTFSGRPSSITEPLQQEKQWQSRQSQLASRARSIWLRRIQQHSATAALALQLDDSWSLIAEPGISYNEVVRLQTRPVVDTILSRSVADILGQLDQRLSQSAYRNTIMEICHNLFTIDALLRLKRSYQNFYHEPEWLRRCAELFSRPVVEDAGELLTMDDLLRFYALSELGMEIIYPGPHAQSRVDKWFYAWIDHPQLLQHFTDGQDRTDPKVLQNVTAITKCLGYGALLFLPRNWSRLLAQIEPAHMYGAVRLLQPSVWRSVGEAVVKLSLYGEQPTLRRFQAVDEAAISGGDIELLLDSVATHDSMEVDQHMP